MASLLHHILHLRLVHVMQLEGLFGKSHFLVSGKSMWEGGQGLLGELLVCERRVRFHCNYGK
jgi:hypothetical protein